MDFYTREWLFNTLLEDSLCHIEGINQIKHIKNAAKLMSYSIVYLQEDTGNDLLSGEMLKP